MENQPKPDKKKRRLFKNVKGYKRFLLFTGLYLLLLLILIAGTAEYTSRPSFCPTCHYMEPFYQSWRVSAHNKIDCVECHFEPGISGTIRGKLNGLVQIVNYISLSYKKRKPWAEIPDNTCARSGCHEKQALQDTTYDFKGISFNHKHHLQELRRGKTLKCTSCHSQIVQGNHIEVTESTCFNCHFIKSLDIDNKYDKLSNCTTCHDWKSKTKEQMANFRYDHTSIANNNISCLYCHTNTVVGNGDVGKERCFQCHFETERLEKYDNTQFMHTTHISKHSVKCFVCHTSIQHKIQKMDPNSPPDCIGCHENSHTSQVSLYTGNNGINTDKTPSPMYLDGINCKGCHIFHETSNRDISTSTASGSSCESCHGKGYDKLVAQWKEATSKRLATINSIYKTVLFQVNSTKSSNKSKADKFLEDAYHNLRIVEVGKSVHNIQFADRLLIEGYNLMVQALSVIGSNVKLPAFQSGSEFIPNECYNCHSGIQEITVKKYDMNFSHNQHIVKEKIPCAKCHSNQNKHGELIVTKQNCNTCHHSDSKSNDACGKCHSFQAQIYNGSLMNKNQPDVMKQGGVGCIDCHVTADVLIKPDNKICLKCHDDGYSKMMVEWRQDIKDLLSQSNSLINELKGTDLSTEQQNEVAETKKLTNQLSSYSSIYVHNYDLISTLLTEKIKALKKLKK